jgi:hypothetical protein
MFAPVATRRTLLATVAVFLSLCAASAASEATSGAASEPMQPRLAYLTETATSVGKVWIASANGTERKLLGVGQQPLLAPDGQLVAVSLFGTIDGVQETGPAIGLYPASGAPIVDYLKLEEGIATPLAWSQDSAYLAVYMQSTKTVGVADGSSLDVIDTTTGTVTTIAKGAIYGASFAHNGSDTLVFGLSHSESLTVGVNLYESEPDGAGLHRLTSDGHSLNPVWGPRYIAFDHEHARKLSPEDQIWLDTPSGVLARKLTHIPLSPLVQGLVPLAFSVEGEKLLAAFEGEDTTGAYAVNVANGRVHQIEGAHGESVMGAGISSDGRTLLIDEGSFEAPPSHGRISTIRFAGGRPRVLVKHASQASWDR